MSALTDLLPKVRYYIQAAQAAVAAMPEGADKRQAKKLLYQETIGSAQIALDSPFISDSADSSSLERSGSLGGSNDRIRYRSTRRGGKGYHVGVILECQGSVLCVRVEKYWMFPRSGSIAHSPSDAEANSVGREVAACELDIDLTGVEPDGIVPGRKSKYIIIQLSEQPVINLIGKYATSGWVSLQQLRSEATTDDMTRVLSLIDFDSQGTIVVTPECPASRGTSRSPRDSGRAPSRLRTDLVVRSRDQSTSPRSVPGRTRPPAALISVPPVIVTPPLTPAPTPRISVEQFEAALADTIRASTRPDDRTKTVHIVATSGLRVLCVSPALTSAPVWRFIMADVSTSVLDHANERLLWISTMLCNHVGVINDAIVTIPYELRLDSDTSIVVVQFGKPAPRIEASPAYTGASWFDLDDAKAMMGSDGIASRLRWSEVGRLTLA